MQDECYTPMGPFHGMFDTAIAADAGTDIMRSDVLTTELITYHH